MFYEDSWLCLVFQMSSTLGDIQEAYPALATIDHEEFKNLTHSDHESVEFKRQESAIQPCVSIPDVINPNMNVSDDILKTFLTPRKQKQMREVMVKETERHRCALKMLTFLFTKEELSTCNTEGTFGKGCLDSTRLNALKGNSFLFLIPTDNLEILTISF